MSLFPLMHRSAQLVHFETLESHEIGRVELKAFVQQHKGSNCGMVGSKGDVACLHEHPRVSCNSPRGIIRVTVMNTLQ